MKRTGDVLMACAFVLVMWVAGALFAAPPPPQSEAERGCPPTATPLCVTCPVQMDIVVHSDHLTADMWVRAVADDGQSYSYTHLRIAEYTLLHIVGAADEYEGFDVGEEVRLWVVDGDHCARVRTVLFPIPWRSWQSSGGFREVELCAPGDLNCDGVLSPLDMVQMFGVIFRNAAGPNPPDEYDLNQDDAVDSTDLIALINVVFRNGDPGSLKW